MKRAILLSVILLFGCQSQVDATTDIHTYVENIKEHAETNRDTDEYIAALEEFTDHLEGIEDEDYQEYVEAQIEANNARIEALNSDDVDLITESSLLQAQALEILYQLEESQ